MPLVIRAELFNRGLRDFVTAQKRQAVLKAQIQELVKNGQLKTTEGLALESHLPPALAASPVTVAFEGPASWAGCFDFRIEPAEESGRAMLGMIRAVEQPAGSMTLDEKNLATIVWVLDPQATDGLKAGTYRLRAKFDTTQKAAKDAFKGSVDSNFVELSVKPFPTSPAAEDKIRMFLAAGEYQLVLKNWDKAVEAADGIVKIDPDSVVGYELRGRALEAKGDLKAAIAAYSSAVSAFYKLYPNSYDPPLGLLKRLQSLEERRR
jgi:tetratricopeptide (TPR) repeat protein